MDAFTKKIILWLLIVFTLIALCYAGYRFYLYAVQDITERVRESVAQGAQEGISKGVGKAIINTLNPFTLFGRLFER